MAEPIPDEVQRFIARHIKSLDQLEVLMLVSALPDRDWTVESVFHVVQTQPDVVRQRLGQFVSLQMLVRTGPETYRYAPRNEALARQVAAVADLYKLRRHTLIELIYAPRTDELRQFSDAFRLRKDDHG